MPVATVLPLERAVSGEMLEPLRAALRAGGVLAIPTDTFYGLAADPLSELGVGRVYALKGRSCAQALPVVIASTAQLAPLGVVASPDVLEKLEAIWPAPLTAVLPLSRPIAASGGAPTLAVRVPAHGGLRRLLAGVGPLTATSANRRGQPPALSADDAARIFGSGLDFVVNAGPSQSALPSTIVDLTKSPPEILRSGAFPWT
jgi:L-threonylcarbamoyladenylate synthase